MNDIERIKLYRAIDEMLRNSIAESPRQAATLRELVLDAIEEAGFDIVGRNPTISEEAQEDAKRRAEAYAALRSTHHVHRGPDSIPCYCAATSDHPIGQERAHVFTADTINLPRTK